jgi:pyruvate-formate lyase-activating enzyme
MKSSRSSSKVHIGKYKKYKINGKAVSKDRYDRIRGQWDKENWERTHPIRKPNQNIETRTMMIPGYGKFSDQTERCPEGYHWVRTYEKHHNRGIYKSQVVRGYCAKNGRND